MLSLAHSTPSPKPATKKKAGKPRGSEAQSSLTSVRLYKEAVSASKENEVILLTDIAQSKGVIAIDKIFGLLRARY